MSAQVSSGAVAEPLMGELVGWVLMLIEGSPVTKLPE